MPRPASHDTCHLIRSVDVQMVPMCPCGIDDHAESLTDRHASVPPCLVQGLLAKRTTVCTLPGDTTQKM